MTYGQWLRTKRKDLGLTQRDVEERARLGLNALSKIENDIRKPVYETRQVIHAVLGSSDADLADHGILEERGGTGHYD